MKLLCSLICDVRHCLLLAALLTTTSFVRAQNTQSQPMYIMLTYMKTAPGKFNEYERLLHTYSKKVMSREVQQGNNASWSAYQVLMPTGTASAYNIVSVTASTKLDQLLDPAVTGSALLRQAFPEMSTQQADSLLRNLLETRSVVKRELYTGVTSTAAGPPTKAPTKYVQVDFMTPVSGKESQYVKMEQDMFRPIHKERVNLDVIKGWVLMEKVMPSDYEDRYPYVTMNYYETFSGMVDGKYEQALKKALPNQDINKLIQYMNSVKKGQRSELWKLLEYDEMQGK